MCVRTGPSPFDSPSQTLRLRSGQALRDLIVVSTFPRAPTPAGQKQACRGPLKRGAKVDRPFGAGFPRVSLHHFHQNLGLTYTLNAVRTTAKSTAASSRWGNASLHPTPPASKPCTRPPTAKAAAPTAYRFRALFRPARSAAPRSPSPKPQFAPNPRAAAGPIR